MITKLSSRKKTQTALALAVSLWMAGGSVASAGQTTTIEEGNNYEGNVYGNHANGDVQSVDPAAGLNNNIVNMTGGNVTNNGAVFGAFFETERSATWNKVTVSGGTIGTNELAGAASYQMTVGDEYYDNTHDVSNNTVTVTGSANIQADIDGAVTNNGTADSNHVIIEDGTVNKDSGTGHICGGRSNGGGDATNNTVTISGGTVTVRAIIGGSASNGGNATGNTVMVSSDVTGVIYGGCTADDTAGDATGNKVTLNGATVTGDVYGGGTFTGTFTRTGDLVTGNTLNLSGASTVNKIGTQNPGKVQNFQTINIVEAKWGTPVLTLNGAGIVQNANGTWATIDASDIAFSGVDALSAGETTKLIENKMANYQGTIKSGKYKVGTTLEGTGKASVSGDDLIYTIEPGTAREQTHNTVMGASVSMTALSMGNEFVGAATEGLAAPANVGADGVSSFAQMGGGSMRQETGSHVDTHTWNAILALGHQNKKERGTMEYGAFFEYGTGNYTTHADNGLRGDGSARYTGGGLLAKYTMKNSVYVEGSLRAGSVHDDARNVLSDGFGNPYSYDTNAAYMGFHLGVGKEIAVAGGNAVDVYGKYFYNRRNGVSFDAGGHYDLDAVTSSVLRVGARYILKREKWNFYAGAAYEHEFDGKANGTADGVAIRGADTSGGSFRGEIGATVKPGENSPWNIDLNVSGFAGKKQGFTGGVSVALMF